MSAELITCGCCGGTATVDARSASAQYAYGDDAAARAMRHQLVTAAANGSGTAQPL
uniref:hypothetical protein n=1 Tax=Streptosporangium sp. CA-256172 TaxID=3240076 RepID=UPI003F495381